MEQKASTSTPHTLEEATEAETKTEVTASDESPEKKSTSPSHAIESDETPDGASPEIGEIDAVMDDATFSKEIIAQLTRDVKRRLGKVQKEYAIQVKGALAVLHSEVNELRARSDKLVEELEARIQAKADAGEGEDSNNDEEIPTDAVYVSQLKDLDATIEQKRSQDMTTMKQELHHMVYAHNHNADLMKRLKIAMDEAKQWLDEKDTKPHQQKFAMMMPLIDNFLQFAGERQREMQSITPKLETLVSRTSTLEALVQQRLQGQPPSSAHMFPLSLEQGKFRENGGIPSKNQGWGQGLDYPQDSGAYGRPNMGQSGMVGGDINALIAAATAAAAPSGSLLQDIGGVGALNSQMRFEGSKDGANHPPSSLSYHYIDQTSYFPTTNAPSSTTPPSSAGAMSGGKNKNTKNTKNPKGGTGGNNVRGGTSGTTSAGAGSRKVGGAAGMGGGPAGVAGAGSGRRNSGGGGDKGGGKMDGRTGNRSETRGKGK